jgi:hypothetical protein
VPRESGRAYLSSRVAGLLHQYVKGLSGPALPMDLERLAHLAGIREVRDVQMVPEGVLNVDRGEFVVYLQNNFVQLPSGSTRRRFTLAHEICHTLFFEQSPGKSLRRRRISEDDLEALCNIGAGWLLLPDDAIYSRIRREGQIQSVSQILEFAKISCVSLEVLFRRLHDNPSKWLQIDNSFVLLRESNEGRKIRGCAYGPWLTAQFPVPRLWEMESEWLSKCGTKLRNTAKGDHTFESPIGLVTVVRHRLTSQDQILHIQLRMDRDSVIEQGALSFELPSLNSDSADIE